VNSAQTNKNVVVLGTGGTIAGTAACAADNIGYTAAQVGVQDLLDAVPGLSGVLRGHALHSEQVAQIDSKDMDATLWLTLAQRVQHHLEQPQVSAVLITHGTDTLEETAFFLHLVLPSVLLRRKPVVLTCAMRPSTALCPDGPQNLLDAISCALTPDAHGVVVVCAGSVHAAQEVQKVHTYRPDAFSSGDAGPLAVVEEGQLRMLRNWPLAHTSQASIAIENIPDPTRWPRVEIVMSHAGCSGDLVTASLQPRLGITPMRGLVVAATGNGTLHHDLESALQMAAQAGVKVVRASRCVYGRVLPTTSAVFTALCRFDASQGTHRDDAWR
jgi:L-asparaginase